MCVRSQPSAALEGSTDLLSTDVGHRDIVTPSTLPYAWRVKGFVRFTDSPSVVTQVGATGRDVTSMSVPGRLLVLGCDCEQVDALPGSVQYSAIEAHHVNGLGSKGVVGAQESAAVPSFSNRAFGVTCCRWRRSLLWPAAVAAAVCGTGTTRVAGWLTPGEAAAMSTVPSAPQSATHGMIAQARIVVVAPTTCCEYQNRCRAYSCF